MKKINQNYLILATYIMANYLSDIDKMTSLLVRGNKKDKEYLRRWYRKREEIKSHRMNFAKNSSFISMWADCMEIDEIVLRKKIINFVKMYPRIGSLKIYL